MMVPSFFTKETGSVVPGFDYTESGQAHKPDIAMAKLFPLRTLVVGRHDLSTGGMLRHDPDNYVI
jgi:hypothetical protein